MKRWFLASGSTLLLLFGKSLEGAEVYRFVDSAGVVHFSNVPTDLRYRPFLLGAPTRQTKASLLTILHKTAKEHGVDPALVRAVIKAESDFNPDAVSHLGAQGLMQLMPLTSINLNVQNPFDPEENISGGVRYLKYLLNLFHQEIPLALAAYHAGERTVLRVGGIPPIEATQLYVERVLKFYRRYRGEKSPLYKTVGSHGEILYTNRPNHYPGKSFRKVHSD